MDRTTYDEDNSGCNYFSDRRSPGALIRLSAKGQSLLTPPSWLLYGWTSVMTASSLARSFEALSQVKCSGAPLQIKALHKARSLWARLGDWQWRKQWSNGRDRWAGDQVGVGEDHTDWLLSIWHGFKATEKGAALYRTHQRDLLCGCTFHLHADSKSALCEKGVLWESTIRRCVNTHWSMPEHRRPKPTDI